jgi:hypothetical protein
MSAGKGSYIWDEWSDGEEEEVPRSTISVAKIEQVENSLGYMTEN